MHNNHSRWVDLEIHLLIRYEWYWQDHTRARGLLKFNVYLCLLLICWYNFLGALGLFPYRPPTFNPWYVRLCHNYFRWRAK